MITAPVSIIELSIANKDILLSKLGTLMLLNVNINGASEYSWLQIR